MRNSVYENSEHKASFTITETDVGIEMVCTTIFFKVYIPIGKINTIIKM